MNRTTTTLLLTVLVAGVAPAQSETPPDALKGPSVAAGGLEKTIVERTFDGSLKKLDVRPEEAAVRKLDLSSEEKSAVDKVLAARAASMDQVVRENFELLLRLHAAKTSGNADAMKQTTQEFHEVVKPLVAKGPLVEQISNVLAAPHVSEFQRMVRDYYRAVIAEGMKKKPSGDPMPADDEMAPDAPKKDVGEPTAKKEAIKESAARRAAATKMMLDMFGQEVRRSYERIAAEGQSRLDELTRQLDLTPEQDAKIKAMALEYAQQTKFNANQQQRAEFFRKIAQELTPEQRKKLVDLVLERRS